MPARSGIALCDRLVDVQSALTPAGHQHGRTLAIEVPRPEGLRRELVTANGNLTDLGAGAGAPSPPSGGTVGTEYASLRR